MSREDLQDALRRLKDEIESIDEADSAERDALRRMTDALQRRIERAEGSDTAVEGDAVPAGLHAETLDKLSVGDGAVAIPVPDSADEAVDDNALMNLVETYEARYPRVTMVLNDLMTRLASMGI